MMELGMCGHGAGASSNCGPRPRRVRIDDPPERWHGRTVPAGPDYRRTLAIVPTRYDVDRDALARILADEPRYRVDQVWDGLYGRLASPVELTVLPLALRARLDHELPVALSGVTESADGSGATVKWLFGLDGGARIEDPTPGYPTRGTPPDGVRRFRRWLHDLGVNATVRRNRGTEIDAAWGQLAAGMPVRAAVGGGSGVELQPARRESVTAPAR
jgi:hypothetical protein